MASELLDDPRLAQLADWGGRLAASGLSPDTSGNLSCRTGGGFLITRTGVSLATIGRDDWVAVAGVDEDPAGSVVVESRGIYEPSRDSAVHATLYRRLPAATSIFHLHVGNLEELSDRLGVPATSTYHPAGTTESMREIERFLDDHPDARYFVLVAHGIVAWGASVDEAGELVAAHQLAVEQGADP